MQATFHSAELLMRKGQILELGDAARGVITGICGAVWLTRDGDLSDSILGPGQTLEVRQGERVWISAFDDARVRVEQRVRRRRGVAERLARSLRALYLRYVRRAAGRRTPAHSCSALAAGDGARAMHPNRP